MELIQDYCELQLRIDSLDKDNIVEAFKWIRNSSIYRKNDGPAQIISILLQNTYIRPKNIGSFVILAELILKPFPVDEIIKILVRNFKNNSPPFSGRTTQNVIFFINTIDLLNIPKENVIDQLIPLFTNELFERDDNFNLFIYLGPDLEKYKPELFESIKKQYDESLPKWISNFNRIRANDWALLKQYREDFGVKDGINYAVRNDDLSAIRIGLITPTFSLDQTIIFNVYEPTVQINKSPSIFDYALFCGSLNIVQYYLVNCLPKDPMVTKEPIHAQYAIAGGNVQCISLLQQYNFTFEGCLHVAAMFHQKDLFYWLVENDYADFEQVFPNFGSVLHAAIKFGNFDASKICVETQKGASLQDNKGRTPLHVAVLSGLLPYVEMILSMDGVDVNAVDLDGMTPLMLAVEYNYIGIIKRLLEINNIEADCVDSIGLTALGHAACNGHVEILKLLLERNDIDVNRIDEEEMTPILSAYESGEYECCLLLAKDERVDLTIRNEEGQTIAHLAQEVIIYHCLKLA